MPGKTGTALAAIFCLAALIAGVWIAGGKAGNHPARLTVESPETVALPDAASETPAPLYRVHVLWEDNRQPAVGTSVTLIYKTSKKGSKNAAPAPSLGETPMSPQTLKTDASGVAAFPLPSGGTPLRIEAARAYALSQSTSVTVTATQETTLLLKKAYECFGTVYAVNDTGTTVPIQGARVSIRGQKDFQTRSNPKEAGEAGNGVLSDERGRFRLVSPTPQVVLQASKGPLVAPLLEKDRRPRVLRHEVPNGPCNLILEKGCSLLVSVLRKDTMEGIEGARVEVEDTCPEKPFATNKDGECEVQGLPQGMVKVVVWADGYAHESTLVALSPNEGNLAVFTLAPAGQIKVFTVDDKDQPVGGVGVSLQLDNSSEVIGETFTDETGHGELKHAPMDVPLSLRSVPGSPYSFMGPATSIGFTSATEVLDVKLVCRPVPQSPPPQPEPEGPYWLKGRVVESTTHQPVPGLIVESEGHKKSITDEHGEFCVRGLEGPEFGNLGVIGKGYKMTVKENIPVNTSVEIEISRSATILGKVVDSQTSAPIQSFSVKTLWGTEEGLIAYRQFFSLDGTFELEDFYPNSIEIPISIKADPYEPLSRDIRLSDFSESGEIVFALHSGNKARGKIVDAKTHEPVVGALVAYSEGVSTDYNFYKISDLLFAFKVFGKTNEKGEFSLDLLCDSGTFRVFAEGYASTAYPVTSGKSFPVEIPLEKSGTLKIRFQQGRNSPLFVRSGLVTIKTQSKEHESVRTYYEYKEEKPDAVVWKSLSEGEGTAHVMISNKNDASEAVNVNGHMPLEMVSTGLASGKMYNTGISNRDGVPRSWTEILQPVKISTGDETEIEIPADSALSGRLTLKGTPVQGAVFLESGIGETRYLYMASTNKEGVYQIPALISGDYVVSASMLEKEIKEEIMLEPYSPPYRENLSISGTVQKDFDLDGVLGHKVTGKIRMDTLVPAGFFPENGPFPEKYRFYSLRLEQVSDASESPVSIYKCGSTMLEDDGSFCVKGRLRGQYQLILEDKPIGSPEKTFFKFPEPFTLDNIENDQDLGEIDAHSTGPLSLTVTILPPEYLATNKLNVGLLLERTSLPFSKSYVSISSRGTANVSGLLPGEYRVRLIGWGAAVYYGTEFDAKTLTLQDNITLQYDARTFEKKPDEGQPKEGQ